eukprot:Lankesteria_metandrocarpae@DN2846_c0_g1_i1.p1
MKQSNTCKTQIVETHIKDFPLLDCTVRSIYSNNIMMTNFGNYFVHKIALLSILGCLFEIAVRGEDGQVQSTSAGDTSPPAQLAFDEQLKEMMRLRSLLDEQERLLRLANTNTTAPTDVQSPETPSAVVSDDSSASSELPVGDTATIKGTETDGTSVEVATTTSGSTAVVLDSDSMGGAPPVTVSSDNNSVPTGIPPETNTGTNVIPAAQPQPQPPPPPADAQQPQPQPPAAAQQPPAQPPAAAESPAAVPAQDDRHGIQMQELLTLQTQQLEELRRLNDLKNNNASTAGNTAGTAAAVELPVQSVEVAAISSTSTVASTDVQKVESSSSGGGMWDILSGVHNVVSTVGSYVGLAAGAKVLLGNNNPPAPPPAYA